MAELSEADLDAQLTKLIESDPDLVTDPFPIYRALHTSGQIRVWGPTIVVSGFDLVKTAGDDHETFSNNWTGVGSRAESIRAGLSEEHREVFEEMASFESLYVTRMDGAQHARLRKIAGRFFRPRKIDALNDVVQDYVDQLIDEMRTTGSRDIIDGFSAQLPTMMICSLLDIPIRDVPRVRQWSLALGKNRGGAVLEDLVSAHAALQEFRAYVQEIVENDYRSGEVKSELALALQEAQAGGEITFEELLATIVVLLFAGSDTTAALLGNGIHALLSNPEQWELLTADPEERTFDAVEELMRYLAPVQTTWRVSTTDTELGGVSIPAGTTALLMLGAANRDPEHFIDAERFDITRGDVDHLAFLSGAHFCIGAALARLEANIAFKTLATRYPKLRMAEQPPITYIGNVQFRTVGRLEVEWGD